MKRCIYEVNKSQKLGFKYYICAFIFFWWWKGCDKILCALIRYPYDKLWKKKRNFLLGLCKNIYKEFYAYIKPR